MMRTLLAILAGLVIFGTTIPYFIDILRGKVKPLRSTRLMFLLLMVLTFFQQRSLGTGITMTVTVAETMVSLLLFGIAMKKGVGGFRRLDLACYGMLLLSVTIWITSKNAAVALAFTILADLVAFLPVLIRTAMHPKSETQLFYWGAVIGPLLSFLSTMDHSYKELVFIAYLGGVNLLVILLINRQYFMSHRTSS